MDGCVYVYACVESRIIQLINQNIQTCGLICGLMCRILHEP